MHDRRLSSVKKCASATLRARTSRHLGLLATSLLAVVAACASLDDTTMSRERCVHLRDHVIDLRLGRSTPHAAEHKTALKRALGDRFVESCLQLSANQVHCAFAAKDTSSAVACTASSSATESP